MHPVLLDAVAPYFEFLTQFEVEGADIPCNGKPVCKLCQKADDMTSEKAQVRNHLAQCPWYVVGHGGYPLCYPQTETFEIPIRGIMKRIYSMHTGLIT